MYRKTTLVLSIAVGLVLVALAATGCAGIRASQARQDYIDQATRSHVYDKPCEQVWPDARQLLFAEGYSVKDTGEGTTMTVETEWNYEDEFDDTEATRYLVQGSAPRSGTCKVEFTRSERDDGDLETERDLEMEWELLQRVDPAEARQIRAEAEEEADRARNK